jgi:Fungal trichothecene efflux pump (TRI12)
MMAFSVAFLGALSTCNADNFAQSAAFSFLSTFTAGILEIAPVILCQLDTDDSELGTVVGMWSFTTYRILYANTVTALIFCFRSGIGSIITAVFLAILTSKVPTEIAAKVVPAALAAGLPETSLTSLFAAITAGTPAAYAAVPDLTPEIQAVVAASLSNAYAAAYAYVYYAAVAVGIVGLGACCAIRDYDPYFTNHLSRQIYKAGEEKQIGSEDRVDVEHTSSAASEKEGGEHIEAAQEKM